MQQGGGEVTGCANCVASTHNVMVNKILAAAFSSLCTLGSEPDVPANGSVCVI